MRNVSIFTSVKINSLTLFLPALLKFSSTLYITIKFEACLFLVHNVAEVLPVCLM